MRFSRIRLSRYLSSLHCREARPSQAHQDLPIKLCMVGDARQRSIGALAAALQVPGQSVMREAIDVVEGRARISLAKLAAPALKVLIDLTHHHPHGFEAHLRAHGLIRKVSGTRYYCITQKGYHVMIAALRHREIDVEKLAAQNACQKSQIVRICDAEEAWSYLEFIAESGGVRLRQSVSVSGWINIT